MKATQATFLNRLGLLAKHCQYPITKEEGILYDRALQRFGYDRAVAAVEEAIIERRGNDRMPSIGDLVQRCAPQVLDADTAVEVAGRIWTAISKFGQYRALDAAGWIGEVGWYVVQNNGGWQRICETALSKDQGIWKAQLRDHAAAAIRRQRAGLLNAPPTFGEASNRVAGLVGQVLKKSEDYDVSTRNAGGLSPASQHRQLNAEGDAGVSEAL